MAGSQTFIDAALAGEYERTDREARAASGLLDDRFGVGSEDGVVSPEERDLIRWMLGEVDRHFGRRKFILGTAINAVLLAEALDDGDAHFRSGMTEAAIFEAYPRVTHDAKGDELDTLTLTGADGREVGNRGIEMDVLAAFQKARRKYSGGYAHNASKWHRYVELLEAGFSLSRRGRRLAANALFDYGLLAMPENTAFTGIERPPLFYQTIDEFPRGRFKGELGGSVFQGIAYGFFKADRPHLSVEARNSRTSSAKQGRVGDVQGFYGASVEFVAEVKDLVVTESRFAKELESFVGEVERDGLRGIVVARDVDEWVAEELAERGVHLLTQSHLLAHLELWDYAKQDVALYGLLHYLSHVERSQEATQRLLRFIRDRDAEHPSLTHLQETEGDAETG